VARPVAFGVGLLALAVGLFLALRGGEAVEDVASERLAIVDIPNAHWFDESVLVGGQPSVLNLQQAVDAGYRTVINLRPEGEFTEWNEEETASALGLRYVSIPVAGASGLTRENAARLRAELDAAVNRPVLLHCASGNRVGALLALSAFYFDGASPETALEVGLHNGLTSLRPRVAEYLASAGGS